MTDQSWAWLDELLALTVHVLAPGGPRENVSLGEKSPWADWESEAWSVLLFLSFHLGQVQELSLSQCLGFYFEPNLVELLRCTQPVVS